MRRAVLTLLVIGWLGGGASGSPIARARVVLSDADLELRRAMQQALAPWHLQIVIEGEPPPDETAARERADADTARFVVWRDDDQLVVYDRELGSTERRPSRAGPLDAPTAAAAALTIKTMMRLPPPDPPDAPEPPPAPPAPADDGLGVRLQAGVAIRIARAGDTSASARFAGVVAVRPWASGWRFGVAADAGAATAIERASFKGSWSEWAVLGLVTWTWSRGAWELEPHAGGGIRRSVLDGTEMGDPRSDSALLATARGGLWVRLRYARVTVGATLDADAVLAAPTYSKRNSPAEVFQVPGSAVELGAVMAIDLGAR